MSSGVQRSAPQPYFERPALRPEDERARGKCALYILQRHWTDRTPGAEQPPQHIRGVQTRLMLRNSGLG